MSISVRIRVSREEKGLSQAELASAVGVTRGACGHWEQGKSVPSVENLARIAGLLGVRFEWLATGRGPQDYDPAILDGPSQQHQSDVPFMDGEMQDLLAALKRLPPTSRSRLLDFVRSLPVFTTL